MNSINTEEELLAGSDPEYDQMLALSPSRSDMNSYDQALIDAFKFREERAFWAMVLLGLLVSKEYQHIWIFAFIAIFGAFQLSFMALIRDLAKKNNFGKVAIVSKNSGVSGRAKTFLSDARAGIIGNGTWWILGVILLFVWTQTGLRERLFPIQETLPVVVSQTPTANTPIELPGKLSDEKGSE